VIFEIEWNAPKYDSSKHIGWFSLFQPASSSPRSSSPFFGPYVESCSAPEIPSQQFQQNKSATFFHFWLYAGMRHTQYTLTQYTVGVVILDPLASLLLAAMDGKSK